VLVIAFGAFFVNTAYWHPYIPENTGTFGEFGISGILRASGIIFFAYIGFDAVSTAAQEAKNPQRDMPIGILGSLIICTILYILMSAVLTGLVPYPQLNDAAPVVVALQAHPQLQWLKIWVIIGALAGLTSVILVMILAQARIFLTMAQHGLLPPSFAKVHPQYRTPHVATIVTGLFAMIAAGLLPINVLSEMVSIGTLIAFIVVCIGVLVLRHTRPDLPRPFRVKGIWFVSIMGVIFCGVSAYVLGPLLLRSIPEPVLEEGETKVPYAALAGRRAAYWCGGLAAVSGGLLGLMLGLSAVLPAWLLLAVAGAVLGYIDARTRFLPSVIIWPTERPVSPRATSHTSRRISRTSRSATSPLS